MIIPVVIGICVAGTTISGYAMDPGPYDAVFVDKNYKFNDMISVIQDVLNGIVIATFILKRLIHDDSMSEDIFEILFTIYVLCGCGLIFWYFNAGGIDSLVWGICYMMIGIYETINYFKSKRKAELADGDQ